MSDFVSKFFFAKTLVKTFSLLVIFVSYEKMSHYWGWSCVFCVLIPDLYLWGVLPINLGSGLSSSHQKTMSRERERERRPHSLIVHTHGHWIHLVMQTQDILASQKLIYVLCFYLDIFGKRFITQWCQIAVANDCYWRNTFRDGK